jgi:putative transposase
MTGIRCGRDKLFDILREENMLVPKKKKQGRTTNSYHKFRKHQNLIKEKEVKKPEEVWVSDITYIPTDFGKLYLFLTTDFYSKKIMGWNLSGNLKTESAIVALKMALKNRRYKKRELIHHSDRGLQYCDPDYTDILEGNDIKISMTTKYDPYENAVAERVNGILKDEFDIACIRGAEKSVRREIKRAIHIYNTKRMHLSCEYMTPEEAHRKGKFDRKKWPKRFSFKSALLNENLSVTLSVK